MARRIVAVDAEGLVARVFYDDMCERVRHVAERARVGRGMGISLGLFAIVELVINVFEEGDSLFRVVD